jgi:hypothetical protein
MSRLSVTQLQPQRRYAERCCSLFLNPLRTGGVLMLGGWLALSCSQTNSSQQESEIFELAENEQFLFKGSSRLS